MLGDLAEELGMEARAVVECPMQRWKSVRRSVRYEFVSGMFPWGCELNNSRPMAGIKLAACGCARPSEC
jgi:hypothetical protein